MPWLLAFVAAFVLAHTAPFPFALDVTKHTLWRMPATTPPVIYLTFDAGPNPASTPQLLDVLAKHETSATFFVLDQHLTAATQPLLRRIFEEGHAVGLHSHERRFALAGWGVVATTLQEAAARIEVWTGHQTCRAFRPRAGYRSVPMLMGAARAGYTLVGWGSRLNASGWFRRATADALVPRLVSRASAGQIIALEDGAHDRSGADRQYVVEAVDRAIPLLKAKGFQFGTICP